MRPSWRVLIDLAKKQERDRTPATHDAHRTASRDREANTVRLCADGASQRP